VATISNSRGARAGWDSRFGGSNGAGTLTVRAAKNGNQRAMAKPVRFGERDDEGGAHTHAAALQPAAHGPQPPGQGLQAVGGLALHVELLTSTS
jgi:hypothetical protein